MKRIISFSIAVVLFCGLLGVYFLLQNKEPEIEPEDAPPLSSSVYIIEKKQEDVVEAFFDSPDKHFRFTSVRTPKEKDPESFEISWDLTGYDNTKFQSSRINDMMRLVYSLNSPEMVLDKVSDLSEYGLDEPKATAKAVYSDGSENTLIVGNMTPAEDYYYVMLEGDPALYLLYKITGDRFFYGLDDLVDKTIPFLESEYLEYIYIRERGKAEIEFDFDGTEEEKEDEREKYGAIMIKMIKPYPGRDLYFTNFQMNVLENLSLVNFNELIDMRTDEEELDLSKYGLDDPSLEIRITDQFTDFHLILGDEADEDGATIYVMQYGSEMVFTANKSHFNHLFGLNVNSFIEKFVAIVNIGDVEFMEIKTNSNTYSISLNHEFIYHTPEPGEEPAPTRIPADNISPTINDSPELQDLAFKTFYQQVIGITYDTEIPVFTPENEPDVVITYKQFDDKPDIITRYYMYNDAFYAVQRDENPIMFVCSKDYVDRVFTFMEELLAGNLDRDI